MREVGRFADRAAQRVGEMIDGELALGELGKFAGHRRDRARAARAERGEQRRHRGVGLAGDKDIDRRQALIVHAPAIVQAVIDRHLHDFGGDAADLLEGAGDVDPVEAENDVGGADGVGRLGRQHVPPGAPACSG